MKLKRFLSVCLAAMLVVTCCACSAQPGTPAQVVEKMQRALDKAPCSHAQMVVDIAMTLDGGESGTLELTASTTNDIQITQKPVSGYTTAAVEVTYDGETNRTFTENYAVVEDGGLVSYIHSNGVWLKLSTGQTAEDLAKSASTVSVEPSSAAIDEAVTEYQGKEVICLTTRLSGDALQATLGGMLESVSQQGGALAEGAEAMGAIDYAALTCDARIYLDEQTYLPLAEEMTFSGLSDVLAPLYAQAGITVDVTDCTASAVFLSYEAQEAAVLPQGAAEKAETWARLLSGEPDNGDGTFTIREGTVLLDIVPPQGFEVSDTGYDHVYFTRDDHREVRYTVHYGTTATIAAKIDGQLARYGSLPKNISRQQMSLAGDTLDFEADIVGVEWQSYEEGLLYGWSDLGSDGVGTYFIFVEVMDGYNDGLGHSKSADVTPEEFVTYLNAATPSELMEG